MIAFDDLEPSRQEFARVPSQDGALEAGEPLGEEPAVFTYRLRPEVRWAGNSLLVDDTGAATSRLLRPVVDMGARSVQVELETGGR